MRRECIVTIHRGTPGSGSGRVTTDRLLFSGSKESLVISRGFGWSTVGKLESSHYGVRAGVLA